jgi:hypothetical protein
VKAGAKGPRRAADGSRPSSVPGRCGRTGAPPGARRGARADVGTARVRLVRAAAGGPGAPGPTSLGVWQLPDGEAYYAHTLCRHVTADVTAEELHQLGLRELESLHQEMRVRFTALGFPAGETIAPCLDRAAHAGGTVPASEVVSTYTLILLRRGVRSQASVAPLRLAEVIHSEQDTKQL